MSRLVRKPVTLFSFAFVFLAVPVWLWTRTFQPTASLSPTALLAAPMNEPTPPPTDLRVMMLRAGLSPEALTAAGIPPGLMASLAQSVRGQALAPTALAEADARFANARRESDRLERLIQSGKSAQEDVEAYQAARAALTCATSEREAALGQVFDAATAGLPSQQRGALLNARANASWNLAPEFLVVNRSQEDWVRLRDALANEKIARKLGDAPDPGSQAMLANLRAVPAVAAARGALEANLAQMRTNWNTATSD